MEQPSIPRRYRFRPTTTFWASQVAVLLIALTANLFRDPLWAIMAALMCLVVVIGVYSTEENSRG